MQCDDTQELTEREEFESALLSLPAERRRAMFSLLALMVAEDGKIKISDTEREEHQGRVLAMLEELPQARREEIADSYRVAYELATKESGAAPQEGARP